MANSAVDVGSSIRGFDRRLMYNLRMSRVLTAERLREVLAYDAGTGVFTWRPRANGKIGGMFAGDTAGCFKGGYIQVSVDRRRYRAHRLAWLYVHGHWPDHQIDHINGDPQDNRIMNLREASNTENSRNAKRGKNNTSGFKGVSFSRAAQKWQAQITRDRKVHYLGLFTDKEAAADAYRAAAAALHGQFARFE